MVRSGMRLAAPPLPLTETERQVLEELSRSRTAPYRDVQRARALLLAGQGLANTAVAGRVGTTDSTVKAWRDRFAQQGLSKFGEVAPGRGRKPMISEEKIAEIVRATQETTPPGQTHWSCRSMAKAQGVSPATVQRIWSSRGLKPHLVTVWRRSWGRWSRSRGGSWMRWPRWRWCSIGLPGTFRTVPAS